MQKVLGKFFLFECSIGMNGRTWIKSQSVAHTILIANAIEASEYMTSTQIEQMVKKLAEGFRG